MSNPATFSQGSRVAHASAGTAFTAIAAGASLPGGWTQVNNVTEVDGKPVDPEKYDDSSLEDTTPQPRYIVKPGMMNFSKKKNSQSLALAAMCDGVTPLAWVIISRDGDALYTANGLLMVSSILKASAGDFKAKSTEAYDIQAREDGPLTFVGHA